MIPSLVIFDCDGVLVDSEPITNRELSADLSEHGLALTTEQCIELFVGGTMTGVYHRAIQLGAQLPRDWVERFYDRMCAALGREVTAIAGARDAAQRIADAGLDIAIGSNGPMRKMEITLGRTGQLDLFRGRIYSAHDIGIAKPDPGFYAHVAHAMGHDPLKAVVVEDSASGVRSAVGAGIRCLGFAAETSAEKLAGEGAETFTDMAALPGLIGL